MYRSGLFECACTETAPLDLWDENLTIEIVFAYIHEMYNLIISELNALEDW